MIKAIFSPLGFGAALIFVCAIVMALNDAVLVKDKKRKKNFGTLLSVWIVFLVVYHFSLVQP
jgi:hypothetical protein